MYGDAGFFEEDGDAADVVAPMFARRSVFFVEIELDCFVEMFGVDIKNVIVARSDGDACGAVDCGGEDEAVVIVGVLADDVGAAGSAENARRSFVGGELAAERLAQVSELVIGGHFV